MILYLKKLAYFFYRIYFFYLFYIIRIKSVSYNFLFKCIGNDIS